MQDGWLHGLNDLSTQISYSADLLIDLFDGIEHRGRWGVEAPAGHMSSRFCPSFLLYGHWFPSWLPAGEPIIYHDQSGNSGILWDTGYVSCRMFSSDVARTLRGRKWRSNMTLITNPKEPGSCPSHVCKALVINVHCPSPSQVEIRTKKFSVIWFRLIPQHWIQLWKRLRSPSSVLYHSTLHAWGPATDFYSSTH